MCGGLLEINQETSLKTDLRWERLNVRGEEKVRPFVLNILAGGWSFETQIWWELHPWVAGVYPVVDSAKNGFQSKRKGMTSLHARESCEGEGEFRDEKGDA